MSDEPKDDKQQAREIMDQLCAMTPEEVNAILGENFRRLIRAKPPARADAMSDDIVKRLRTVIDVDANEPIDRLLEESADEIERLTADVTQQADALRQEKEEVERLREENRKLRYEVNRSSYHD